MRPDEYASASVFDPRPRFHATRLKSQAPPNGDRRSPHQRPAAFFFWAGESRLKFSARLPRRVVRRRSYSCVAAHAATLPPPPLTRRQVPSQTPPSRPVTTPCHRRSAGDSFFPSLLFRPSMSEVSPPLPLPRGGDERRGGTDRKTTRWARSWPWEGPPTPQPAADCTFCSHESRPWRGGPHRALRERGTCSADWGAGSLCRCGRGVSLRAMRGVLPPRVRAGSSAARR